MSPPAPPPSSSSANDSDAFHRVGRALIACWPQWSSEPDAGDRAMITARQRNRLLDETGSDYRPLVDLLIDLGHSIRPTLHRLPHPPLSASAWDTARAPIVHRIVSTRYLQPDVARWAVDVWARALNVSPVPTTRELVAAPQVRTTLMVPYVAPTAAAVAVATHATQSRAVARFGTLPPLTTVPTPLRPQAPSWAGGPASFGVGAKVKPAARSALLSSGRLVPGTSRVQGPKYLPVERLAAIVLAGLLLVVSISLWISLRNRAGVLSEPIAARVVTSGATPIAAPPSARLTAPASVVPQPSPELREALASDHADTPFVSPIDAGVAGRYRVTQRIRSVDGSSSCESVARALGVGRETEERITHVPGRSDFRITSRGVEGMIDHDGRFEAEPLTGTTNNIPWQFRMRGRFLAEGFTGTSETYTQAILRWGRTQSCVVTADFRAIRLPD